MEPARTDTFHREAQSEAETGLPDPGAAVAIPRHRFTVHDFARLGEAGIFTEDDRAELIDGEIRDMTPIGQPHARIVNRLTWRLVTRLAGRAYVSVQNPLRLDRYTEPQPDLVVARGGEDHYADRHLEAGDVLLVVEVADSSLRYDRIEKMPRYAGAGIPEAWLVDVAGGAVTVSTDPGPDGYAEQRSSGVGRSSRPPRSPTCASRSMRSSARSVTADVDCSPRLHSISWHRHRRKETSTA